MLHMSLRKLSSTTTTVTGILQPSLKTEHLLTFVFGDVYAMVEIVCCGRSNESCKDINNM